MSVTLNTVIAFIVVFGLLVFVHEFGHYWMARRAGILAREFAIGFGPKLFSFKRSETLWTIRLLPLGGYVRMAGEDGESQTIQSGTQVRLLFDQDERVTDIILDSESRPGEGEAVIVEKADLEDGLWIEVLPHEEAALKAPDGAEESEENRARVRYRVFPQANIIQHGDAMQIAPRDRQFGSKTIMQRFLTLLAGPLANILLSMVLFTVLAAMNGVQTYEPVVGSVVSGMPAELAGLKAGDKIVSLNGKPVNSWVELQSLVAGHPGQTLKLVIERDGAQYTIDVTAERAFYVSFVSDTNQIELVPGDEVVAIGGERLTSLTQAEKLLAELGGQTITLSVVRAQGDAPVIKDIRYDLKGHTLTLTEEGRIGITQLRDYSIGSIILSGPKETMLWIERIFVSLGSLFTSSHPLDQVGGPVAIFKLTGDAAGRGLSTLILWTALLSVNLGIINALPFPALDGGRMLFLLIEALRGRPIDQSKEGFVHLIGFALLILLIIVVTWNDIQKLF
ncbi:MAG: site-2 protease family protein [Candidatus Carbobacillus altaicus]|nr:site-2 protease family protein [Candidatus Carbobacillus altaicus]